ncbi:MAG: hypothetical protein ACOY3I_07060 [Verrucomicrobiota bacterium]
MKPNIRLRSNAAENKKNCNPKGKKDLTYLALLLVGQILIFNISPPRASPSTSTPFCATYSYSATDPFDEGSRLPRDGRVLSRDNQSVTVIIADRCRAGVRALLSEKIRCRDDTREKKYLGRA